jgi:ElaB/YqjD/DUF883 family membrane-anchored ribosome-binding protein
MRNTRRSGRITAARHEDEEVDFTTLRSDLTQVKQDLAELTRHLFAAGQDGVRLIDERVREKANGAVETARKRIETRPLTAIGGAVAAGLLIGMVARWMRNRQEA